MVGMHQSLLQRHKIEAFEIIIPVCNARMKGWRYLINIRVEGGKGRDRSAHAHRTIIYLHIHAHCILLDVFLAHARVCIKMSVE